MNRIINKGAKGFTLIELLVVIAIIGILASIVLVSLNSARNKGKDTRVISDINQIRTQIESEASSGGGYSAGASYCLTGTANTVNTTSGNCKTLTGDASANGVTIGAKTYAASGSTNTSYSAYTIYATLPSGAIYCVDSTGNNGTTLPSTNYTSATGPAGAMC